MTKIQTGVTVKVHYTGKHIDGEVFDSTVAREPIIFTIGDEMMIPGFENAVCEMQKGEKKSVVIPCEEAYGEYDPELMVEVKRKDLFDENREVKIGDQVQIPIESNVLVLAVKEIKGDTVVLDGNSDLVGKDLVFEIELLEILDGSSESYVDEYNDELGDDLGDDFADEFGDDFLDDDLMYGAE